MTTPDQNPKDDGKMTFVETAIILVLVGAAVTVIIVLLGPEIGRIFSGIINGI